MKAYFADEQRRHDPKSFLSSGAPKPNPEVPEATTPAKAFADTIGSAIVLCSDPDADRVGLLPPAAVGRHDARVDRLPPARGVLIVRAPLGEPSG